MQLPRRKIWDLVGEGQINEDGTARQDVLAVLQPGERLTLERQPDNPHDSNAVAVVAGRHIIGYIPRFDAAEVAALLDAGIPHRAQLHELTGGVPDYPSFGARVAIAWRDRKMPNPLPLRSEQTLHQSVGKGGMCAIVMLGIFGLATVTATALHYAF